MTYRDLTEALQARLHAHLEADRLPPCDPFNSDGHRRIEALEAQIAALQDAVATTETLGEQQRQEAGMAAKRVVALEAHVATLEDAVAKANATSYGLAAGVWTRDVSKAHRVARALEAGTVWVITYNLYDPALPFGGFKESGFGRELGLEALDAYLETKSVWLQLS